jgi:hypothetical protein
MMLAVFPPQERPGDLPFNCPRVLPEDPLSPAVRQFLREYIQSIEQLEILQVLQREPLGEWTAQQVYDVIRSNAASIESRLRQFAEVGLVAEPEPGSGRFRFSPKNAELSHALAETLRVYRVRSVQVIETIFKPAADGAQRFADAFRFKPK